MIVVWEEVQCDSRKAGQNLESPLEQNFSLTISVNEMSNAGAELLLSLRLNLNLVSDTFESG